jgi:uncharacterized membrane protein
MIKKFHIILPLLSAVIIGSISYFQGDELKIMSIKLIFTIVLFYLLGLISRSIIEKSSSEYLLDIETETNLESDHEESSIENSETTEEM